MDTLDESRELLDAVTALRLGLVEKSALIDALAAWSARRDCRLAIYLAEKGVIPRARLRDVEAEAAAALKAHRGDVHRALGSQASLVGELRRGLTSSFDTLGSEDPSPSTLGTIDEPGPALPATEPSSHRETPQSDLSADQYATIDDRSAEAAVVERPEEDPTHKTIDLSATPRAEAGSSWTVGDLLESPSGAARRLHGSDEAASLRYQILRLHAKGGLGQVFVARDRELNREVALKEIQGRHADHDDSQVRFLVEAEVTGNLEHPGIVPVYGLGRYPDGRPYYAMRFIRGESLHDAIQRFHEADADANRDPGERAIQLRKLLGQLVDVCNAIAYAHSRGVLHRDLKPGNIMLGSFGETLVVDWGLAKFKDGPPDPDSGSTGMIHPMSAGSSSRTLYGTAVGTPQYMSPEQAGGQLEQLGPPSDVYSLGAILYTILTGEAPFRDRNLNVILDKVRKGDFAPPRFNHSWVPAALEAVCLKAMALRPEDRYATANLLAEDIEHWMADEPVSVYREPWTTRAARWARRHRTAVAAAAALLVTATVSLAAYSVLIKREQQRTERFYLLARKAVDSMLTELGEETLVDVPQLEPVRAKMLKEAKDFYEELREARADDPRAVRDLALATVRVGDIEALLGDPDADAEYTGAIKTLKALAAQAPTNIETNVDLARALHSRGLLRRRLNRLENSRADLVEAHDLRKTLAGLAPDRPEFERAWTDTLYHLAALHARLGQSEEARPEYEEAIARRKKIAEGPNGTLDDRRMVARYTNNLANLVLSHREEGSMKEAEDLYRQVLGAQDDVVKEDDATTIYRFEKAKTHGNLRIALASQGRFEEAEDHAEKDVELSRRIAGDFQKIPEYQVKLATARSNLGELRLRLKQYDEAAKDLDEAVAVADRIVEEHGDHRDYRSVLAAALLNRAVLRDQMKQLSAAEEDLVRARDQLAPLADVAVATPEDLYDLGTCFFKLGAVRARLDRRSEAIADLDQAVFYHDRAAALGTSGNEEYPMAWKDLSMLSDLLQVDRQFLRCAEVSQRLPELRPDHSGSYLRAARTLAVCTLPTLTGQNADDPAVKEQITSCAQRALRPLEEAARRKLLPPQELASLLYSKVAELHPEAYRRLEEAVKPE